MKFLPVNGISYPLTINLNNPPYSDITVSLSFFNSTSRIF